MHNQMTNLPASASQIHQQEALPEIVGVVLTIERGQVTDTRSVYKGEITASFETFIWMAEQAGYQVIPPARSSHEPDSHPRP